MTPDEGDFVPAILVEIPPPDDDGYCHRDCPLHAYGDPVEYCTLKFSEPCDDPDWTKIKPGDKCPAKGGGG